jgi:uncharacterized membrane protein YbhN (UPF0104 family)
MRRAGSFTVKLALTVGAFWLLLAHRVQVEDGRIEPAWRALMAYLPRIDAATFWRFALLATAVKCVGITAAICRWSLLLRGQGVRFGFGHLTGSFLIGRFLGTFLPSTVGLDAYKLYDAARFSGRTAEATAATVVEKVLGVVGLFTTFLVALPFGAGVLGERAALVTTVTVPLALLIVTGLLAVVLSPAAGLLINRALPAALRARVGGFVSRTSEAAVAYRRAPAVLGGAMVLSFLVHFCTAVLYYFTAIAVGAPQAPFWEVTLASSIQIFATVMSPFTIAGEGVREIAQAALLAGRMGMSPAILSGTVGFWAAEAPTLFGGIIYVVRRADYRPRVTLDGLEPPVRS